MRTGIELDLSGHRRSQQLSLAARGLRALVNNESQGLNDYIQAVSDAFTNGRDVLTVLEEWFTITACPVGDDLHKAQEKRFGQALNDSLDRWLSSMGS